jgi:hypothetical protein
MKKLKRPQNRVGSMGVRGYRLGAAFYDDTVKCLVLPAASLSGRTGEGLTTHARSTSILVCFYNTGTVSFVYIHSVVWSVAYLAKSV